MRPTSALWMLILLPGLSALAEDEKARRARQELEREVKALVDIPEPRVEMTFGGPANAQYALSEATFVLDGKELVTPPAGALAAQGGLPIFQGEVASGTRMLTVDLVYTDGGSGFFSYTNGYKYKLKAKFSFLAQRGLLVRVKVRVNEDPSDSAKKLKLGVSAAAEMVAKLEDGVMPASPTPVLPASTALEAARPAAEVAEAPKPVAEARVVPVKATGRAQVALAVAGTKPAKRTEDTLSPLVQPELPVAKAAPVPAAAEPVPAAAEPVPAAAEPPAIAKAPEPAPVPVAVAPVTAERAPVTLWIVAGLAALGAVGFFALSRRR